MKKFLSMIITAAMLICMQSASFAAARIPVYRANGAIFFFDKASGRISGFAGEPKDLIIPSSLGGYKVTVIGKNAFGGCKTLQTLSIPEGVTTIEANAFVNCSNLRSVEIPSTVTYIGDSAFVGCSSLSNVIFKGFLENIEPNAFYGTPWLTGSTAEFVALGGTTLIKYNGSAETIYVPQGIKYIEQNAFAYNNTVKEIVLPEGAVKIGANAFVHCNNLEKIYIPSTVSFIGTGAFDDTKWLKNQTSDFVCVNGMLVYYGGSDSHVEVPSGIKGISGGAFLGNEYVRSVQLPDGIIYIDEMAFGSCKNLVRVNIPYTVEMIDDFAFSGSALLTLFSGDGSYAQRYCAVNGINFSTDVYVRINGEMMHFDNAPAIIKYERTFIPFRAVFEKLGYEVSWNAADGSVTAKNDEYEVTVYPDGVIKSNGETLPTVAPPVYLNGSALVSVRVVAEGINAAVDWNETARAVNIIK